MTNMVLEINNPQKQIIFFNRDTNKLIDNIWSLLSLDRLRSARLMSHEQNISRYVDRPDQYKEVLLGIVPIPPRSKWLYDGKAFFLNNNSSIHKSQQSNISDLLSSTKRLLKTIKKKGIAIELSGGLDTSIAIGLLYYHGIEPLLIGMKSNRYEFRTEAKIQEIYCKKFSNSHLFSMEDTLPYTDLLNTPIHQLPSSSSLFYAHANPIAKLCMEKGIKIVLTGMGFDALLCDSPYIDGHYKHPDSWFSCLLDDNWFNEYVYKTFDVNCKSAACSNIIIQTIWSMRQGQGEDIKKWWARKTFADFLPRELVQFAYKANHNGNYIDGMRNATEEIRTIFITTYDITRFEEFNKRSMNNLIDNILKHNDKQSKTFLGWVSFANWIYGLARDNII